MAPSSISSDTRDVIIPRPIPMRRASSARDNGSCSRTRLRMIRRLMSREVERVALTKLPVSILLMSGCGLPAPAVDSLFWPVRPYYRVERRSREPPERPKEIICSYCEQNARLIPVTRNLPTGDTPHPAHTEIGRQDPFAPLRASPRRESILRFRPRGEERGARDLRRDSLAAAHLPARTRRPAAARRECCVPRADRAFDRARSLHLPNVVFARPVTRGTGDSARRRIRSRDRSARRLADIRRELVSVPRNADGCVDGARAPRAVWNQGKARRRQRARDI